ncbi:Rad4 transglutaminase-like domain-containing protein [Terfezia claveryi]|nr:Rad4 transglutaminase-like domain-containing protein [Terfezia claveryi]
MPPKRRGEAQVAASSRKKAKSTKVTVRLSSDAGGLDEQISHDKADVETKGKAKGVKVKSESGLEDPIGDLCSDVESSDSDSSEEEDWENCLQEAIDPGASSTKHEAPLGDLEVTLEPNKAQLWSTGKKGVSGVERTIRMTAHMLHTQFLLYHGFRRNSWLCDEELQAILFSHLTPGIAGQVEKYHQARQRQLESSQKVQEKGKSKSKSTGKGAFCATESAKFESTASDPLVHLLGALIHFWKKQFIINAPGLRKNGYLSMAELAEMLSAKGGLQEGERGTKASTSERVENLRAYREMARKLEGSRDVGAQFFTALLRALGFEARLVFSLQPLGFRFHECEEKNGNEHITLGERDASGAGRKKKRAPESSKKPTGKRKKAPKLESDAEHSEVSEDEGPELQFEEDDEPMMKQKSTLIDRDLQYPIFWTEVFSPHTSSWIAVDALVLTKIFSRPDTFCQLEPRGKQAQDTKQVICYVIGYSSDSTAKDVTVRYLTKNIIPGRARGFRVPNTVYPIKDSRGNVIRTHKYDWFRSIMRRYSRREDLKDDRDREEDQILQGVYVEKKRPVNDESILGYKNHPDFILERHLKREEAVEPGKSHIKLFSVGKGEKAKEEKVYRRQDIVVCKTIENWYKEGRVLKEGEQPLKRVKSRAVTLNRRRELEQAAEENNPILQGLYSYEQTKLYDPPPILDGKVPRNVFGNCDVYVDTMIPEGGVHLSLKGTAKIAKKLGIDYADAVTGFEFKKQRAIPVIDGIVIPAEHEALIRDAWTTAEKERKRKEDIKREQAALALWRKFLMGIRIVKRIQEEYGAEHQRELIDPSSKEPPKQRKDVPTTKSKLMVSPERSQGFIKGFIKQAGDSELEDGGFLRSGEEEAHQGLERMREESCGFFAGSSYDNLEGGSIQETAQIVHCMGGGFMEEDAKLSRTSFDSESVYTRNGSRHMEAPHINIPAKKPLLSTNSRTTPHQNQLITSLKSSSTAAVASGGSSPPSEDTAHQNQLVISLKSSSTAAVASGESSPSSEDTSAGKEHESKYEKATSIRTSRLNQVRESGSDISGWMDFDAMDVDFQVPRSARNQFGEAEVSANDQQLPASQKANRSPKKKAIPVFQVSNSGSKRSTPAKSMRLRPTRQAAAKATRKLRTQSKYFLAGEEQAEEE